MKPHIAQQFEFAPCADAFNLSGEVQELQPENAPATIDNRTPELLFVDRSEMQKLRSESAKDLQ